MITPAKVATNEMSPEDLLTEQVKQVFRLTGGELHLPREDFPDAWDKLFDWWYEGRPEYAEHLSDEIDCDGCVKGVLCIPCRPAICGCDQGVECPRCEGIQEVAVEYRTGIASMDPPDSGLMDGEWNLVATFTTSGETECLCCGEGEVDECPVCEDGDGVLYIGDGWYEAIYRRET
jgi:hypothetical protein